MSDLAATAVANSIQLELKKDGLSQRQSGDWSLRFTVAATDMDQRLAAAAMGTRYQAVLVEIDDNEEPVEHKAIERDKWRDLGPVKQAALRCKDPVFWAWLRETYPADQINDEKAAAIAVREICNVNSRADLGKPGNQRQRVLWHQLDQAYQAWKVVEHA